LESYVELFCDGIDDEAPDVWEAAAEWIATVWNDGGQTEQIEHPDAIERALAKGEFSVETRITLIELLTEASPTTIT
jgi:hypothetical protein